VARLYRRHVQSCPHRSQGQRHWTCKCPLWVRGSIENRMVRQSTGLTDWDTARDLIRKWESEGGTFPRAEKVVVPPAGPKTLDEAWQDFLKRKTDAQKVSTTSVYKYRRLRQQLDEFAVRQGLRFLKDFTLNTLEVFQTQWTEAPITCFKKLERMKTFFRFAHSRGWLSVDPTVELLAPKVPPNPTLPFERQEMQRLLAAIDVYPDKTGKTGQENALRLRAFVLLLRYSGLRIGDAVRSRVEQLHGTDLYLRTEKTGQAVYCPLPSQLVKTLLTIPRLSEDHIFWTGQSTLHTAIGIWQRTLKNLFELAGIQKGHAHRFRDTFAVELLLSGVPMDRVSTLLGHSGIRITEKHYAPWVRERQKQLTADVRKAYGRDPILASLGGTQAVRREGEQKSNLFIIGGKEMVPAGGIEPTA
jgi:integrase/recombinase XerD